MKYYLCTYHISISKTPNGGLPNRIILVLVGQKKENVPMVGLDLNGMEWPCRICNTIQPSPDAKVVYYDLQEPT